MTAAEVIAARVNRVGISIAELARRTDIHPELLRRSLNGERVIKADELIRLCVELELSLADFQAA